MKLRLAGTIRESIVDGPGIRYVAFVQGCPHRCPGCHNPDTHAPSGGYEVSTEELSEDFKESISSNPLLSGVTISGGEPFEQAAALIPFAETVKKSKMNLWIYTGYRVEEIIARADSGELALLASADAIVDGRFEIARRTLETPFVGSANQKILRRDQIESYQLSSFVPKFTT
jgi:anaerobic ribonucleoside-triphosphate reductase activating protein